MQANYYIRGINSSVSMGLYWKKGTMYNDVEVDNG